MDDGGGGGVFMDDYEDYAEEGELAEPDFYVDPFFDGGLQVRNIWGPSLHYNERHCIGYRHISGRQG
jgi:hypothetical protein